MSEEQKEQQETNEQIEKLVHDLENEKKRSEEYLTRLKYAQADIENLKKRYERQLEEAKKYGNENLIVELLEIIDELEMAIKSGCSSDSAEAVINGVEMTLKKLEKILKKEEVSPIECIDKPFDPSKHNAVEKIEKKDVGDCTVVEEIRKGYILKGKVIRPSIVKISVKTSSDSQEENSQNE